MISQSILRQAALVAAAQPKIATNNCDNAGTNISPYFHNKGINYLLPALHSDLIIPPFIPTIFRHSSPGISSLELLFAEDVDNSNITDLGLFFQDFCSPEAPFPPVNSSGAWSASPSGPFVPQPNSSLLAWASNASDFPSWPPLSALRLVASLEGQSCVEACQSAELICEPALFRFINIREAFSA